MTLEAAVEAALRAAALRAGGRAVKVESAVVGFPDRLVLLPGARYAFVELKAPGKKPRRVQKHWHDWLRDRGFTLTVIDSPEQAQAFVESLRG